MRTGKFAPSSLVSPLFLHPAPRFWLAASRPTGSGLGLAIDSIAGPVANDWPAKLSHVAGSVPLQGPFTDRDVDNQGSSLVAGHVAGTVATA